MDRTMLIRAAALPVIIGLLLLLTCLGFCWHMNSAQKQSSEYLADHVGSLEAAHDLQLAFREFRFRCFVYLVDPTRDYLKEVHKAQHTFEERLGRAARCVHTPEEHARVKQIEAGHELCRKELKELPQKARCTGGVRTYQDLAGQNPARHLVSPCEGLLRANAGMMKESSHDSWRIGTLLRVGLLLIVVGGPLSGAILGFGMAGRLRRSIARLSVHVHSMARELDREVGEVSVTTDGDIEALDAKLRHVVRRVEHVTRRLQQQSREMLRVEQLSTVGHLAASMAHEVRNPLTSMKMLVESALRGPGAERLTRDDLAVIHGEITRLQKTVQNVLDFARLPTPQRRRCDLRQVIAQAVTLVRARVRQQQVELVVRCPRGAVAADVDPGQVCTVLVNLFLNALDAMPEGGRLEVSLRRILRGGGGLRLTVADSGSGIPAVMTGRLFTPFASTKPRGTGLGLSICKRVVEEHGGRVEAENRPEGGACLTVVLPPPAKQSSPAPEEKPALSAI